MVKHNKDNLSSETRVNIVVFIQKIITIILQNNAVTFRKCETNE